MIPLETLSRHNKMKCFDNSKYLQIKEPRWIVSLRWFLAPPAPPAF